ncbi:MAG: RNA repair domain-containing protein [Archaeoglobaceae archaeon]
MRRFSAREMLNKLKWDQRYDFSQCTIVCIDRFSGMAEISADEIESIGHKFLYLKDGRTIPQHRIVEIRHKGEVVWKRP